MDPALKPTNARRRRQHQACTCQLHHAVTVACPRCGLLPCMLGHPWLVGCQPTSLVPTASRPPALLWNAAVRAPGRYPSRTFLWCAEWAGGGTDSCGNCDAQGAGSHCWLAVGACAAVGAGRHEAVGCRTLLQPPCSVLMNMTVSPSASGASRVPLHAEAHTNSR